MTIKEDQRATNPQEVAVSSALVRTGNVRAQGHHDVKGSLRFEIYSGMAIVATKAGGADMTGGCVRLHMTDGDLVGVTVEIKLCLPMAFGGLHTKEAVDGGMSSNINQPREGRESELGVHTLNHVAVRI